MPQIKQFNIDQSIMSKSKTKRQYSIVGDVKSEYILQVVSSENKFYNFISKTFTDDFTPQNVLKKFLVSEVENGFILFPAVTGAITYKVLLIATPESGTSFLSTNYGSSSSNVICKTIEQQGDVTVTLNLATANTNSYGDPTTPANLENPPAPNITSTAPPNSSVKTALNTNYVVYNRKTAANGFGLRLTRQPLDSDWYYEETEAIVTNPAGDGVSNNTVIVNSLTGLIAGMELIYHKGTTAPAATTTITNINTGTNTITFSTSIAFENGETMTFRAHGSSAISSAIGGNIVFGPGKATMETLTKTVKSGATSANITITDTYGISGGGHVTVNGVGINNATTNNINTVTEDVDGGGSPDGVIAMDNSSTVTTGTLLTFTGSATQIKFTFDRPIISNFPSADKTIYLNLDNFITPGAAS
jgi:hypothetical protein